MQMKFLPIRNALASWTVFWQFAQILDESSGASHFSKSGFQLI
jgi:hypothetical protein